MQRKLDELFANFFDEMVRYAPTVVIDAIAVMQTLIASHLFHSLLCITKVCHEGMLRL